MEKLQLTPENKVDKKQLKKSKFALTTEQEKELAEIMERREPGEVIVEGYGIQIDWQTLCRLAPDEWLDDELINFYLRLLDDRSKRNFKSTTVPKERKLKCHFWNSFFYPTLTVSRGKYDYSRVQRWSKEVDLFDMDKIITPIHLESHWCLAVINFQKKDLNIMIQREGAMKPVFRI